ncbi:MAG: MlaD family protein [Planctomycetota bacterium]
MSSKGAEIRAGIVVLLGLLVLAVGLFLVSGGLDRFKHKKRYTILFEDAGGIRAGYDVNLAGRKIGEIHSLAERVQEEGGVSRTYVAVTIEVFANERIFANAKFTISETVTGIVSLNVLYGTGDLAREDQLLRGVKLATFEEAIDQASQLLAQAGQIVETVETTAKRVDDVMADVQQRELPARAQSFLDKLDAAAADVQAMARDSREPVKNALDNVEGFTKQVRDDWGPLRAKLQASLDNIESASAEAAGMLKENRDNVKLLVERLKDATLRVAPTLERIEGLAKTADGTVAELRPKLLATTDNAERAMANFKALTEDLKTAPWKLVNKPSDKETREVHLFNAAGSYVDAVAQIQREISELETLRRLGAFSDEAQQASVDEAIGRLRAAVERYDEKEKELVSLLAPGKN